MNNRARILVVDDEEIVCVSIRRILSREGYEVDTVMSAAEAVSKVERGDYNLVITDLMMPEKNGIEMMHAIAQSGKEVLFLMVTGYPTIKTAMQALRLGAIDYIPKPFTRQELLGPVNRALRKRNGREKPHVAAGEGGPSEPVMPGDRFVLPGHSWAVYEQEGTVAVGIEQDFLSSAGQLVKVESPAVNEMVEQGYPAIKLLTADGGEHGVFMPASGRVVAVNQSALQAPEGITAATWVLRVIPQDLASEVAGLVKQPAGGKG